MTKRKSQIKKFTIAKANIFLRKVIKSINSQTNIGTSGNDSLAAKLYQRVSNEPFNVYHVMFINNIRSNNAYVYQSWDYQSISLSVYQQSVYQSAAIKKELYYTHFLLHVT